MIRIRGVGFGSYDLAEINPIKRYFAFYSDGYQPAGGWRDLIGSFDSPMEALLAIKGERSASSRFEGDHWQIVDSQTGAVREGAFKGWLQPDRIVLDSGTVIEREIIDV